MTHLTPDELVDAIELLLPPERQAHVRACERCREQASQLAALMRDVREVEVPEPSPLFWERLSARVHEAIAADDARPPRFTRWFQWPVLAPLAALALLLLAFVFAVPQGSEGLWRAQMALAVRSVDATAPVVSEAHWDLLAALMDESDDPAAQAGIAAAPGSADRIVLQLTSGEQEELVRLLQEELQRAGG